MDSLLAPGGYDSAVVLDSVASVGCYNDNRSRCVVRYRASGRNPFNERSRRQRRQIAPIRRSENRSDVQSGRGQQSQQRA